MYRTRKLSLFIAIVMVLQLSLPGWSDSRVVTAAANGPIVTSLVPADNMTNVALGANLKISFDENVKLGPSTANIYVVKTSTNEVVETIGVNSGQVSISGGKDVIIDPALSGMSGKFATNTDYHVLMDSGAILNASNNAAYSGIQNATIWNFRTVAVEDGLKPRSTAQTPVNGPHPITSTITVSFDEPVYAASGYITLSSTDDTRTIPVTSSNVTGSGTTTITIRPEGVLLPSTAYQVTVANNNFQDSAGNTFDSISWNFSTAAAPVNLANSPFFPADDATLVPVGTDLAITFDQPVQANAGKYVDIRRVSDNGSVERIEATDTTRISINNNARTVTINLKANLSANTAYYVIIESGAFSQPAPNAHQWFYGISAATIWNFSTGYGDDTSAPTFTALMPERNGSNVSLTTPLTLTFNEEVYPNSGNIEIRQSIGGTLFRSIPITSARVKGGGTKQITIDATSHISAIDPAKSFINNTKYYVTIGNRAIRDGAGNFFAGLSGASGWEFTITQDGVRPTLDTIYPASGATAIDVNATFSISFNKPIMRGADVAKIIKFIPTNTGATVSANFYVDPNNNKQILIQPRTPLTANINYYINIDEGAITDLVGNAFIGILNQFQWTFLTKGGDTTAPTVSKSEVSGSVIKLIYNEPLNPWLKPTPASYYVTVAGVPRSVTDVKIEGNVVHLTLSSTVGANQKVELSYTKPAVGLVQDITGNQAATLSKINIANGYTTTSPVVSSGSASGNNVVLNFSESLMSVSPYAYTQFTVTVGGSNYSTTSLWHNGSTVQLTLSGSIPSGQTVRVAYSAGNYPLYGMSGNQVNAFSNYDPNGSAGSGGSGVDTKAPALQYITAVSNIVTIKYNEVLNQASSPGIYQFTVMADSQVLTINNVAISGDSVNLTLNSSISTGQVIRVSYVANWNTIKDNSGNAATSYSQVTATNGFGFGGAATMQSAIVKGNILTITFSAYLDPKVSLAANSFLVRVKQTYRTVSNAQVAGNTIILTLSSPVKAGEQTDISFLNNTSGLKSMTGQPVTAFSNAAVVNDTSFADSLTGDYEAADGGGVTIKTSASMLTSDTSPAGVQTNRYTVQSDKFLAAITLSKDAGITSPRIVFKVPDLERAALVAIPVIALELALKSSSDVTFAVQHGTATYELPLRSLDFTTLARLGGGSNMSNHLLIAIDQGASTLTNPLITALNSTGATIVAGALNYELMVVNGLSKQKVETFSGYISRTLKTTGSVDTSQTAAVWLDPITGAISYVPTTFKTENGVTKATFKRKGNSAYALIKNTASFTDLSNHWSASTVHLMARKFIVEGHTTSKFEPNKSITRGEFATYIAKGLGLSGDRTTAAKFTDVNADTVMGAYIGAAAAAGIVNGMSGNTFKPDSNITRQDMAAMIMRAAKVAGLTVHLPSSSDSYVEKFTDRKEIGAYAKMNVAEAIYLGILTGKSPTKLSPTANATRAEGTVMIMRLLEKAELITK
ncbi:Ig-like domain-containing protein [Paenibacillus sp. GSMTC-2017]|uniref:Ig-like domain-containing protein n=1 Tax=Paenibacillus sp. GSMTC-2017 TaxID=2794350 RepID=UPI0018D6FEE2|nr:Ig-like domain-containing protein [Paenibacillus sp. GSMTC-2017]MBH5320607.1 Ig-like domain-containing protein [Paenibacillus sp. GSMTC-2017]